MWKYFRNHEAHCGSRALFNMQISIDFIILSFLPLCNSRIERLYLLLKLLSTFCCSSFRIKQIERIEWHAIPPNRIQKHKLNRTAISSWITSDPMECVQNSTSDFAIIEPKNQHTTPRTRNCLILNAIKSISNQHFTMPTITKGMACRTLYFVAIYVLVMALSAF